MRLYMMHPPATGAGQALSDSGGIISDDPLGTNLNSHESLYDTKFYNLCRARIIYEL